MDAAGKCGDEALGDVAFRYEGDMESDGTGGLCGGLSDGSNVRAGVAQRQIEGSGALGDHSDCVDAGEDEPVVAVEMAERLIKRIVARGRANFQDGDFNGIGAGGAKAFAEFSGLVRSARDEDAFVWREVKSSFDSIIAPGAERSGAFVRIAGRETGRAMFLFNFRRDNSFPKTGVKAC